jgi:acyl-CoA thioester hydrolase
MPEKLIDRHPIRVRFSEVDSMGVVWHGNYVKFLEDGRESFGRNFGMGYMEVYENGYFTPIVNMNIDYKRPLRFDEEAYVETEYINDPAAIIKLKYRVINAKTKEVLTTAETTQAFLDSKFQLQLTNPDFYEEWKKKYGLNYEY